MSRHFRSTIPVPPQLCGWRRAQNNLHGIALERVGAPCDVVPRQGGSHVFLPLRQPIAAAG